MSPFINDNGKLIKEDEFFLSPNNRSFKFGDGCFETIKVVSGKILLQKLHFHRLFSSLKTLQFTVPDTFTETAFNKAITTLIAKNNQASARVRLTVYRGDGSLSDFDNTAHFLIQSFPLDVGSNMFNETGLNAIIFQHARKSIDLYSSIKSNNYLPYLMGAIAAKKQGVDDCIIINSRDRVAEATTSNLFIVCNGIIVTPPLSEGCINGVMRRHLIASIAKEGMSIKEDVITIKDLHDADEVFLTNAITGIRWVQKVSDITHTNSVSSLLYNRFISPLFKSSTF